MDAVEAWYAKILLTLPRLIQSTTFIPQPGGQFNKASVDLIKHNEFRYLEVCWVKYGFAIVDASNMVSHGLHFRVLPELLNTSVQCWQGSFNSKKLSRHEVCIWRPPRDLIYVLYNEHCWYKPHLRIAQPTSVQRRSQVCYSWQWVVVSYVSSGTSALKILIFYGIFLLRSLDICANRCGHCSVGRHCCRRLQLGIAKHWLWWSSEDYCIGEWTVMRDYGSSKGCKVGLISRVWHV
jgi:hypothetical protein